MHHEIIIAGFGGQGIMFAGQLLTHAGMMENKRVSWIPSYGPEMRGGTANCSVVISDNEISSPIVTEPTIVTAFNLPSFDKFVETVRPDGYVFLNSSLINKEPSRKDIRSFAVPTNEIADNLGNPKVINMVMIGALIEKLNFVSLDTLSLSLKHILPEHRHDLIPLNENALKAGIEYIKNNY